MAFFKCKMCGGTIEFELGATVGVCDSCGTKQTLPRLDDDRKANLYDRANHFRRNNDYDKAMSIYEQILNEDNTDAESYWSILLCRYGIEYVEDPATRRHIPTINRAQYTSVFDDEDYKSALQYADDYQREIYEDEAREINEIQKGILAVSQQEEPFDVFICYKESDANGRRTQDSVLATELYYELTKDGFKVFFSRITLEDKLGTAYEPYIFAALNSAKVMVVLGTRPENFNAVWVKNEWSRYLSLIKNGAKKVLIPAYRDMDPYDLPEEFSHLQAQDMSKLGFMQDLTRGIKKILAGDTPKAVAKESITIPSAIGGNLQALLERGFMALEDGEWDKADKFFEDVLNQDAKCAEAYLGKLMAELKVKKQESLKDCAEPFDGSKNYKKAMRFGNAKMISSISEYISEINRRNEYQRLSDIYNEAVKKMKSANSDLEYKGAAAVFKSISGFKESDLLGQQCTEKAEIAKQERIKQEEADRLNEAQEAEKMRFAKEKRKRKRKKSLYIAATVCLAFALLLVFLILPKNREKRDSQATEISAELQGMVFEGSFTSKLGTYYDKYSFSSSTGSRYAAWPGSEAQTFPFKWEVKVPLSGKITLVCSGSTYSYDFTVKTNASGNPICIVDDEGHTYNAVNTTPVVTNKNTNENSTDVVAKAQAEETISTKSNLDWKATDDDPNDNIWVYYRTRLVEGKDTHWRYKMKINFDNDTIDPDAEYYKNEWSSLEGGRISGRGIRDGDIVWNDIDKKTGSVVLGNDTFDIIIGEKMLTMKLVSGSDTDQIAGDYLLAG